MAGLHHADRVLELSSSREAAAQSAVVASWRRSLLNHGLAPDTKQQPQRLSAGELRDARAALELVIEIARPTLDALFQSVGGVGCCVLMSDARGQIVDGRTAAGYRSTFADWGLSEGAVWSEASEGTNGIGTCLTEKRPVTIHRDQHFHTRNTAMSCMDAPIFGPDGRLLAALDVSSCRLDHTEGFAGLIATAVVDAARRIESDFFQASFPGARIVMGPRHGRAGAVLLAVDEDDLLIGATAAARRTLGLTDATLADPKPAADILCHGEAAGGLDAAERSELRRAIARAGGNVSKAARALGIGRATLYRRMDKLGLD